MPVSKEAIFTVALNHLPSIIAMIKGAFAEENPDDPVPTSEEVIAAWNDAAASSLAKDRLYLDTHKRTTPDVPIE